MLLGVWEATHPPRLQGDTQIVKEDFVEAINNVLNSRGPSVPGAFGAHIGGAVGFRV